MHRLAGPADRPARRRLWESRAQGELLLAKINKTAQPAADASMIGATLRSNAAPR
jgi:hypothetical protein